MSEPLFTEKFAISAAYVQVMTNLVESYGGNGSAILNKAGITPKHRPEKFEFITLGQYESLLREAICTTRNPALGLYMGQAIKFSDHGTFAYSALSFPSVWDAMKVGLKFSRLVNRIVNLQLVEERTHYTIRFDTAYFSGQLYQTLMEMVATVFCEILGFMFRDDDIGSVQLRFAYPPPRYAEQYKQVFDCQFLFNSEYNEVRIPGELAVRPMPMSNPEVARKFEAECDALVAQLYEPKSYEQKVYEALILSKGEFPGVEDIARRHNISPRTLRRRLQECGTSYKIIRDRARVELAQRYLATTDFSVGDIAARLGYHDQNSFSYAYKQLTGMAPTAYRKQQHSKRQDDSLLPPVIS